MENQSGEPLVYVLTQLPKRRFIDTSMKKKRSMATGKGSLLFYVDKICIKVLVKAVADKGPYGLTIIGRVFAAFSVSGKTDIDFGPADLVLIRCYMPEGANTIKKLTQEDKEILLSYCLL